MRHTRLVIALSRGAAFRQAMLKFGEVINDILWKYASLGGQRTRVHERDVISIVALDLGACLDDFGSFSRAVVSYGD